MQHITIASSQEESPRVYLIRQGGSVKIGYSAHPYRRLGELQIANPVPCTMLGFIYPENSSAKELEQEIHSLCSEFKLRGEWFTWEAIRRIKSEYALEECFGYDREFTRIDLIDYVIPGNVILPTEAKQLYHHYTSGFDYTDTKAAKALGLSERAIQRSRLSLTKAGWFKQVSLKQPTTKQKITITYLGQEMTSRVLTPEEYTHISNNQQALCDALGASSIQAIVHSPELLQKAINWMDANLTTK